MSTTTGDAPPRGGAGVCCPIVAACNRSCFTSRDPAAAAVAATSVTVSRRFLLLLLLPLLLPAADAATGRPLPWLLFLLLSSLGGATPAAAKILACSGFEESCMFAPSEYYQQSRGGRGDPAPSRIGSLMDE